MVKLARRTAATLLLAAAITFRPFAAERPAEKLLSFQTSGPWSPRANLNADVAMVYGIGPRKLRDLHTCSTI